VKTKPYMLHTLMLSLIIPTSAYADAAAIETCKQHLRQLHHALLAYQHDHNRLPDALSDLVPRYVSQKSLLHCPDDHTPGEPGHEEGIGDPKQPVSYSYEMSARSSNGLADPFGTPPPTDIPGKPWGSERNLNLWQRRYFGDRVPVVRCYHHIEPGEPPSRQRVLSITVNGSLYISGVKWKNAPDTISEVAQRVAEGLAGNVDGFRRDWDIYRLENYTYNWSSDDLPAAVQRRLFRAAFLLDAHASQLKQPDVAFRLAARWYASTGHFLEAVHAAKASLSRLPKEQNQQSQIIEAEAYRGLGQYRDALVIYKDIIDRFPEARTTRFLYADTLEAIGQGEQARQLRQLLDPGRLLVGKRAPDFALPTLSGDTLDLSKAVTGKKAVLINFWFYH
jgi:hypothetical protein